MKVDDIVKTHTFRDIKHNSKYDFYKKLGACETILSFTKSEGKTFGTDIEKLTIEWFKMNKRINTQHDATLLSRKFEIKSSRYWGNKCNYKFQHLEPEHDFEYLITAVLKEDKIEHRIMKKNKISPYLIKQGKQGFFLDGEVVERIGKVIHSTADILDYINPLVYNLKGRTYK